MNYTVFAGIDQSKLTFDVALFSPSPKSVQHMQFPNNRKGFKAMSKWITSVHACEISQVLFCSEHTGIYSLPLSVFMNEINAHFWLENPMQIKRSSGLVRGKNDKADAITIAHYCFIHKHKANLYKLPPKELLALKELICFRDRLVKMQTKLKNSSAELKDFGADDGGLITKASKSLLRSVATQIQSVDERMLQIINSNESLLNKFNLVKSVHGVGKQTAMLMLVYTNGFTLFSDWRKFACYCGIAPFEYSSGTSIRGKTRVSPLANKKLKSLLTMCALNTIKKKNEFKIYYDRRIAEGKSAMSTINILRNKLVSRVFATVKRGTPYVLDPNQMT